MALKSFELSPDLQEVDNPDAGDRNAGLEAEEYNAVADAPSGSDVQAAVAAEAARTEHLKELRGNTAELDQRKSEDRADEYPANGGNPDHFHNTAGQAASEKQESGSPDADMPDVSGRVEAPLTAPKAEPVANYGEQKVVTYVEINDGIKQVSEPGDRRESRYSDRPAERRVLDGGKLIGLANAADRRGQVEHQAERTRYLDDLKTRAEGYKSEEVQELVDIIDASGLPIDNLTMLVRAKDKQSDNAGGKGKMNTIASMYTHGPKAGTFTTHDIFHDRARMTGEGRKATVVHELTHSLTAFRPENADKFGGEQGRQQVMEIVRGVANQSLLTGVHLNGYHKHLMAEYNAAAEGFKQGRIDSRAIAAARQKFEEETQAILTEMAMFNRGGLARVQADQFRKLDDLERIAGLDSESAWLPEGVKRNQDGGLVRIDRIALFTDLTQPGHSENGEGGDNILIKLLSQTVGVDTYDKLELHIQKFKGDNWGKNGRS